MFGVIKKAYGKYAGMSVQVKATLWFLICNILQKGVSTLSTMIFTRAMTTAEYGVFSIYISWVEILLKFTSLNLFLGVFNNAMLKYEGKERDRYISSMQGLTFTLELVVFVIYLLFRNWWNILFEMPTQIVILMFVQLLAMPCIQFWSTRQRFEYKYKLMVAVTLLQSVANPLLGVVMVLMADSHKDTARILSVVIVEVAVGGSIMIYQYFKGKVFFVKEYWHYAFFFNLPLLLHFLSSTILNHGDRIMIQKMVGEREAGLYAVAYSIGMLMQIVTNAFNSSFTPWVYTNLRDGKYKDIRKMLITLFAFMGTACVLAMFFAPELIWLFGGDKYAEAVYVVPPVSASVFFIFMYNTLIYSEYYYEENKMIMFASLFAAGMNFVLNYIFIGLFGYIAAGYTTLASYILLAIAHYILGSRACKKHTGKQEIFNTKAMIVMSIVVVACTVAINALYPFWIVRYMVIIIAAIVIFVKRNEIMGILAQLKKKKKKTS